MLKAFRFYIVFIVLAGASACDRTLTFDGNEAINDNPSPVGDTVENQSLETDKNHTASTAQPTYVGAHHCADCHRQQTRDWRGSHHDLAMAQATVETVLGNFNDASFTQHGVTSRFYTREGNYFVETEGPDGESTEYRVAYTFGVHPLQQYLIEFTNGRLQALTTVWDTRSEAAGGQRWYSLNPDERIKPDDELHWTGINQTWNFMCADCHSTNLQKRYDAASGEYSTTWSEMDVACESCHGPGSMHIEWARGEAADTMENAGFPVSYRERHGASWTIDPATGNAQRRPEKHTRIEVDSCARCHSRRATAFPGAQPGDALLDFYRPALLEAGLYHADGQVGGEVYVYGSFLQSKMYRAGVTCSDCHNPHSLELRAKGNSLCAQCHRADKYDSPKHHFHAADTEGARCVNCHMPAKTFMGVDARRDHSFRLPRPDLSVKIGTPNACNHCHTDKTAEWAASVLEEKGRQQSGSGYAQALHAGRSGLPGAEFLLRDLVLDQRQPEIARASAVSLLPRYLSRQSTSVLQQVAQGEESLLRYALADALTALPEQYRTAFAVSLLYDQHRVTRMLAARSLAGVSLQQFPPEVVQKYQPAIQAYETSQQFNADRPESLVHLAGLYASRGNESQAVSLYRQAIELAPYFVPAYINLADFYYRTGDELTGQQVLREALSAVREAAPVHHALGLSLVRSGQRRQALEHLRTAAESPVANVHYRYVYGVALNSMGETSRALQVLEDAHKDFPGQRDIIAALAAFHRDNGNADKAAHYRSLLSSGG